MKIEFGVIALKAVQATCAACLIGGGTMVLKTAQENAVQNTRLDELDKRDEKSAETMKELTSSVQQLNTNVAVLNERLK